MPLLSTFGSASAQAFGFSSSQITVLVNTGFAQSVISITVNTPVGAVSGDLLLAFITATTSRNAFSSTGWTEAFGSGAVATGFARLTCLYRKLTAPPSSSYTFSTNLSVGEVTVVFLAVRPYSTYGANITKTFSTTASTTHTIPSSTPAVPVLLVSGFGFDRSATSGMTATDPTNFTRAAFVDGGNTSTYRATLVSYRLAPVGATGNIISTTTQSVQSSAGYVLLTL